jgi:hypothetical protein
MTTRDFVSWLKKRGFLGKAGALARHRPQRLDQS